MFVLVCFLLGFLTVLIVTVRAVLNRHDTKKCSATILLGILIATFWLILPVIKPLTQSDLITSVVYRMLSAVLYSFKVLGGRQDIAVISGIALSGVLKYIYIYLCYFMFFLAPVISSTLIISCFGDMGEKIRYWLHFSKKCYIFSDLNSNSISIAKGIKKADRRATLVFCNTKSEDKALITKAKTVGGICLYKSPVDFKVGYFHKNYEFYLVSDNDDKNVAYAVEIIEKNKQVKKDKITVNAFAGSGVNIDIVESVEQDNIKLRFVDKVALLCNQIIFRHPLYSTPDGTTDISVMIIGCGDTGKRMLKTVTWCGQIEGFSLKARVYDIDAEKLRSEFFGEAPELKNKEYDIKFIGTDVKSDAFIKNIKDSLDATYVFIATGDDALNLETAVKLRGIFRRKVGNYDLEPKILTRIRDDFKTANIKSNKYLKDRNIVAFGNVSDLFEEKMPFETKFERLSLGVHLAYSKMLGTDPDSNAFKEHCDAFYSQEYNRRSSMATALHISAKLHSCGVLAHNEYDLTDAVADRFEQMLKQNKNLARDLAKNEHTRWNAFFRSEGYHGATIKEVERYALKVGKHKDMLSKTHPCITDWDSLVKLADRYNKIASKNEDFQAFDVEIVEAIPEIIRFALKTE